MKEAINLAVRLFIITAVAALVLAMLNSVTAPVIAARQEEELQAALSVAYPEGSDFEKVEGNEIDQYLTEDSSVQEIYQVDGGEGYVYNILSPGGYGGDINFIVGIDEGVIQGYSTLSHSETPGFGAVIAEPEFAENVADTSVEGGVTADDQPDAENEIQGISGATITTNCILNGINDAAEIDSQINQ